MSFEKYNKFIEMHVIQIPQGYLAWKYGTADNVELFDMEVFEKRKGHGTQLVRMLLKNLKNDPPVMIFGFTKQDNVIAQIFYSSLGFILISGVENHCLFWQTYDKLYETLESRKH